MKIRELSAADSETAHELFGLFMFDEAPAPSVLASVGYIRNLLDSGGLLVIAAFDGDRLVGGLTAYEQPKYKREETEMFLYEIGVRESDRGRGIGAGLIEFLKEHCRRKGIREIFLLTEPDNAPARALYEKTGGRSEQAVLYTFVPAGGNKGPRDRHKK